MCVKIIATPDQIHEKTMGAEIAAKVMTSVDPMTSEDMADQVVHILSAPPRVQIHDIIMRPTLQPQ